MSSPRAKEVKIKGFDAAMFRFGECLQFSIDSRPRHHQCITAFSKGDGKESKKAAALMGLGATGNLQNVMS